ncbi:MAG TPA: DUF3105 domain-containing protein [Candidatus Limnocylindria bacterium]|nr:DUF3105 domain-containing protein [Candidatus Limnocylindria bacterium]
MAVTTRRERRERERTKQQRRRSGGGGGGGNAPRRIGQGWIALGAAAAFVGLIILARSLGAFDAPSPPLDVNASEFDPAGQVVGTKVEALSPDHIPSGQRGVYNSVPPTSGQHWAQPAAPAPWGIKDTTLPNEVTTHNLEHGGVVIGYNNLTTAEVDELKGIVRQLQVGGYTKIILQPYPELTDAKVALTAWTWLFKLPTVDQTQIVRFFRAHYDPVEAPERGAA